MIETRNQLSFLCVKDYSNLSNIEEIISSEKRFSVEMLNSYLKNELHYRITVDDLSGFELFKKYCIDWKIL